ncbi:MAG TPA: NAD-dependent epimerase/dehydratase family protein, partial [Candidatus Thermoplasmatota archaeon]|nr:NAD-dependent epimerase/dehydratase family protein [Candidatus Thermoplasmatota archaeon]
MRFTGRKVYLTGATGFIGGRIAQRLLDEGASLTCLVRPQTPAHDLERAGAHIVRGDITNAASLDLAGQHILIHGAAWVGYGLPSKKLPLFRRTNVEGTRNVLHAAERAGVGKVVHVSSIAAIGATDSGTATEESRRSGDFESEYARTKTEAHEIALKATLPSAIPMPGVVLGRGGPFDPLLKALARGKVPALPGDDAVKGYVHVDDVAEGVLLAALRGHGPYLLVDENARTTEVLVAALEEAGLPIPRRRVPSKLVVGAGATVEGVFKLVGKTPPFSGELLQALTKPMRYDSAKARRELGWRPDLTKRLAADLAYFAG